MGTLTFQTRCPCFLWSSQQPHRPASVLVVTKEITVIICSIAVAEELRCSPVCRGSLCHLGLKQVSQSALPVSKRRQNTTQEQVGKHPLPLTFGAVDTGADLMVQSQCAATWREATDSLPRQSCKNTKDPGREECFYCSLVSPRPVNQFKYWVKQLKFKRAECLWLHTWAQLMIEWNASSPDKHDLSSFHEIWKPILSKQVFWLGI